MTQEDRQTISEIAHWVEKLERLREFKRTTYLEDQEIWEELFLNEQEYIIEVIKSKARLLSGLEQQLPTPVRIKRANDALED